MANNEHINKALDDYIEKKDVEGAFYINGLWGSGKTYFIKEFIKRKKSDTFEIQYISLNGIRNISEINEELFCLCNPTISKIKNNKLIKGAGTIFEWILKQKDINLSEFNLNDFFDNINSKLNTIVFDDFERSRIDIQEFFGYVVSLIVDSKIKIILTVNNSVGNF